MMLKFCLTNWKCLLKLGVSTFIAILLTYSCHLSRKVDDLKVKNTILSDSLKANVKYITTYENLKAENEAMTSELMKLAQEVPSDEKCYAPVSFTRIIDKL